MRQLETAQMVVGEVPKINFARVDKLLNTLKSVGIVKEEREIVVRALYANRKYSDLGKLSVVVPAKAPPPVVINDPHPLTVVGGLRGGGSGGQRQNRGWSGGGGRGQQQGGRGQQQQCFQG